VPRDVAYNWNWAALVHANDVDATWLAWEKATRTVTPFRVEYRIRRYDGVYRWHAGRADPVRSLNGEVVLWLGTATDIEDKKNHKAPAKAVA
jgi:PAS domain S-box-containing protein